MIQHKLWGEATLPRIISVGALEDDCFDVSLSNGHTILLERGGWIREPPFAALIESGALDKPQTDGEKIFWPGGPSITLEEILEMLASRGQEAPAGRTKKTGGNYL